ncbi:hypothetical protein 20Sep420_00088 [Pseudomonas phage 20Sep420]|nr:hypothetical protein 20Sep420_00088 [Pseudomonas phage 20Sep420]
MKIETKFSLEDKVVDETRTYDFENEGVIYRIEFEKRGIFYAVRGKNRSWLAKEGALTLKRDFKPNLPVGMEPGEMA